jgi:hypothetical protein
MYMCWWRGFLRQHEDKLVTKRGENVALNRSNWTTLPNIQQMNEVIYDEMVDACVAVSLQNPIFTDIDGKPEDHETKRFGQKQNIILQNQNGFCFLAKVDSTLHKRRMGMLVVRNLLLKEEQPHR